VDPNEGFLDQLREFEKNGMKFHNSEKATEVQASNCFVMRRHST